MDCSYCRTPVVEIILDELIYDNDVLSSFLKVLTLSTHACMPLNAHALWGETG